MRRICTTALLLSALSAPAFAQTAVYSYGGQPGYAPQQPPPPQYYYAQQPRYVNAPQGYPPAAPQGYAVAAPQGYAPAAPQGYRAARQQTYAAPRPASQTYAAAAPQAYTAAAPAPAPTPAPASPNGGGFLQAIFGGPTINVPVSHLYSGYQAPAPQPEPAPAASPPPQQQLAYNPANPPDESSYPIDPKFARQVVAYNGSEPAGTIIVDTPDRFLFLVEDGGKALRYGIGVGRPGFTWSGVKTVTAMKKWPDWTPPPEMIARQPGIPHFMAGGLGNPLGARALYLGSTLYRIHGSNEPWTIGQNVSSGCIRMRNEDVEDLYNRVHIGTKVVII
jgi:lipoprotein-anchoring transpeptidase ErfK/SrfK